MDDDVHAMYKSLVNYIHQKEDNLVAGREVPNGEEGTSFRQTSQRLRCGGDSDISRATALVPLRGHNLVVMRAQLQPSLAPRIKVVLDRDSPSDALLLTHAPVLVECSCSLNAGLVNALAFVDVICTPIRSDGALLGPGRGRIIGAKRLDNVILDERVGRPSLRVLSAIYIYISPFIKRILDMSQQQSWEKRVTCPSQDRPHGVKLKHRETTYINREVAVDIAVVPGAVVYDGVVRARAPTPRGQCVSNGTCCTACLRAACQEWKEG